MLSLALAGCAGLPDQRLANEALKNGDTATAQRNYQALADLGYTEAQVGLADIWMQSPDAEQLKQAEATYREAAKTSPRAQARLGRLLASKPGATEAELHEAQALLQQAFASGDASSLTPLAMLYLQHPQSFPRSMPSSKSASGAPQVMRKQAWPKWRCTASTARTISIWMKSHPSAVRRCPPTTVVTSSWPRCIRNKATPISRPS